jgi:hypothetical protein
VILKHTSLQFLIESDSESNDEGVAAVNHPRQLSICCLILFSVFPLSSCGSPSTEIVTTNQESSVVGTNGQLISIQSDNVRAAGYDESSMVMTVQFDNGALYEYYGVPVDLWTSFVAAQPHPWSQVGYPRLVKSGIPYHRIS